MITDHVYRRRPSAERTDEPTWACAYWNCRRPRAEHERASERGDLVSEALLERAR